MSYLGKSHLEVLTSPRRLIMKNTGSSREQMVNSAEILTHAVDSKYFWE